MGSYLVPMLLHLSFLSAEVEASLPPPAVVAFLRIDAGGQLAALVVQAQLLLDADSQACWACLSPNAASWLMVAPSWDRHWSALNWLDSTELTFKKTDYLRKAEVQGIFKPLWCVRTEMSLGEISTVLWFIAWYFIGVCISATLVALKFSSGAWMGHARRHL